MPFKINIADKGKTWKLESDSETLVGKKLGDTIQGSEISPDLAGYELKISGASDIAGFPSKEDLEGPQLKRVLLTKGWGMHKRPRKEGKKPVSTPKGFRKRKTVRGNEISEKTVQINLTIEKSGNKALGEIFPDQNKAPEPEKPAETPVETPAEQPQEAPKEPTNQDNSPDSQPESDNKETPKEEPKEEKPESDDNKSEEKKE